MKYINWSLLLITVIGFGLIQSLLSVADIHIGQLPPIVLTFILIVLWLLVAYIFGVRRKKFSILADERMGAITDKSARNALIVTWLGLYVYAFTDFTGTLDTTSLLALVVVVGLMVFLTSFVIYYFKGD